MPDALIVLTTIGDEEAGLRLGHMLVEERLAACVQVIPGGTAIYRWAGAIHADPQVQLVIKTSADAWPGLRTRLVALHPDEVPELLALPVSDGLPAYLAWVKDMTA